MTTPTRTRRILGNGPAIKPQLAARYRLEEKAKDTYAEYLISEHSIKWGAYRIADAVIEKVISNFKAALGTNAASVSLSDADVLESMLFDAAIVAEKMDEAGELEAILAGAQTAQDKAKHGF